MVLVIVGTVLTATAQAPASPPSQNPVTAFVHVGVVPMDDTNQVLHDQTVLVRGNRILALGPAAAVAVPAEATRIDGRGQYLIPGLADMHAHLGMRVFIPPADYQPLVEEAWPAIETDLFLYAANGVTTVRSVNYLGSTPDSLVLEARARTAAGQLWGPQIYASGLWQKDPTQSVAQNLAAYQAAGYDFIKLHGEGGVELDSIAHAAQRLGLPIMGHVTSLPHALAVRYASIEHLTAYPGGLDRNATPADIAKLPAMIAATVRAGVWNCPTEVMFELWEEGQGPHSWPERRFAEAFGGLTNGRPLKDADSSSIAGWKLRHRIIKALQDAGGGLLLGTDAPLVVTGFSVHRELQALVRAGLTPYQALATGTRNVAAYFGKLRDEGTIAVGKRADLVLLTGNPLENIQHTMSPAGVMLGGRWLSRPMIDQRLAEIAAAQPAGKEP